MLFVSLDTFRGDFLGAGGDPQARTPSLDRLARQGTQFTEAFASCPITLPSHTSMLTGLEPPKHGVRDNGTFRLPDGIPTLATALRDRGFRTGAFLGAFPLDARFGLSRGFELYDDDVGEVSGPSGLRMAERSGTEVVSRAAAWMQSRTASERWLAWVHLYDPHEPHQPPPPYVSAARGDEYRGDLAWTDSLVGRLVRAATDGEETPWIVLVADHGESRGDHGEATHAVYVYDATLRIPGIVWPAPAPELAGPRPALFRTIDVPATTFRLLGLSASDAPGEGVDALAGGAELAYFESRYAFFHFRWAPLQGVRRGDWKLIAAPEPELFDTKLDPGEQDNVAARNPEIVASLGAATRAIAAAEVASSPLTADDESREALEALGYVVGQSGSESSSVDESGLPDPKRMVAIQSLLESGYGLLCAGRAEEALTPLRSAIARDPRNKEGHQMLGLAYAALNRHREAVEVLVRCLELPPHANDRIPRFELASSYLRIERPQDAARELEKILDIDPKDAPTWYNLGLARVMAGDIPAAKRAWKAAIESDPGYSLAQQALARVGSSTRD